MPSTETNAAGRPFAVMLNGALLPTALVGAVTVLAVAIVRGTGSILGAVLGLVVSVGFYACGYLMLSRWVRSANPFAFLAVGMSVYLAQVMALLLFMMVFLDSPAVDGLALGIVAAVVTIVWQVFAFRAMRRGRLPVYDEPVDGAAADATPRGGGS